MIFQSFLRSFCLFALMIGGQTVLASVKPDKMLIGYWHNFDNGSGFLKLRDVPPAYDIIHIAFAESVDASQRMFFTPYRYSQSEFKADVAALQRSGRKVLISVGGANGYVHLDSEEKKRNFIESMDGIIRTYGFDGIDIDLEGASLSLNPGDTDFKRPVTPALVHLIAAVRELHTRSGGRMLLTMAPETFYVQTGYSAYGGPTGAYLPVIHALRDILTFIHVQHYNTGSVEGLDDKAYSAGNADFHVALAEMLMTGFPIARNSGAFFPGLRPDQVVIGLPASPQAAGSGFTPAAEVHKAFRYLATGQSYGGRYQLKKASGYPEIRGIMTWSINWDAYTRWEFSNAHRAFLDNSRTVPPGTWRQANLTYFTSYPDPGSEECLKYNGCKWAGMFAALPNKQPESWVKANNIAAVHAKDFPGLKLKTLRLRQDSQQIDVKVYDMCSDSDCKGCCTQNSQSTGFLIDLESYTAERFGRSSGIVEWSCLDC